MSIIALLATTFIGQAFAQSADGLCKGTLTEAAYNKGYDNGKKYVEDTAQNTDRANKYKQKVTEIVPDINDVAKPGVFNEIAFCTTVAYVDGIIKEAKLDAGWKGETAKTFLGYFNSDLKAKVCSALKGDLYAAYCSSTSAAIDEKVSTFKDVGSIKIKMVSGGAKISFSDKVNAVTVKKLSVADNAKLEAKENAGELVVEESSGGYISGGKTNIEIVIPLKTSTAIKTVSGDINIDGAPEDIMVDTVTGNIHVNFDKISGEAKGKANIDSVNGNIYIKLPEGFKYAGKIQSVKGATHGNVNFTEGATYILKVGSVKGDIYL